MKALLAVIAVLLAFALALQWSQGPRRPRSNAASPITAGADAGTLAALPNAADLLTPPPPKEEYASVLERPLFLPDRRPPEIDSTAVEEDLALEPVDDSALQGLDFSGVLISPNQYIAWVRLPREPRLRRLRPGDNLHGWTLDSVHPDRLIFRHLDSERVFHLRDYANAPPVIPPTRLPQPPASRPVEAGSQGRTQGNPPKGREKDPSAPSNGASSSDPSPSDPDGSTAAESPPEQSQPKGPVFGPSQ